MLDLKKFSVNTFILENKIELSNLMINYFFNYFFYPFFLKKYKNNIFVPYSIRSSSWFTKTSNLEKLFVTGYYMFLSSGIILRFLKTPYKFLRRRLKTWHGYVDAFYKLFSNPSLIYFTNLFGSKYSLLKRFFNEKKQKLWIFVKLFYLNFIFIKKKKKRIKKWVLKKYFVIK